MTDDPGFQPTCLDLRCLWLHTKYSRPFLSLYTKLSYTNAIITRKRLMEKLECTTVKVFFLCVFRFPVLKIIVYQYPLRRH